MPLNFILNLVVSLMGSLNLIFILNLKRIIFGMKSLLRPLLGGLLLLFFVLPCFEAHARTPTFFQQCRKTLQPRTTEPGSRERQHWLTQLEEADQIKNYEGRLYALLRLAQLQHATAQEPDPIATKIIYETLELLEANSFQQDVAHSKTYSEKIRKTLNFLGLHHPLQSQVFGIKPFTRSSHSLRGLSSLIWDFTFSLGPAVLARHRKRYLPNAVDVQNYLLEVIATTERDLQSSSSETFVPATDEMMRVLREQSQEKISRSWLNGRLNGPIFIALSFMLLSGATPGPQIKQAIFERLPYPQAPYLASDFLRDIENQVLTLQHQRNLLVYSDSLFPKINHREHPPLADPNIRQLVDHSSLEMISVHSMGDLAKIPLGDYDNILILAHGHPDKLDLGLTTEGLPKLKKGANLIFYSCLLGQRGHREKSEEQWVQFSRDLLNGGKAIVSTHTIYVGLEPDAAGASRKPFTEFISKKINQILKVATEVTGVNLLNDTLLNLDFLISNEFYLYPKGLRVFDSQANTVDYFPSKPL